MRDQQTFRSQDLVLRVSPSVDPARFDIIGFLFAGYPAETPPARPRRLSLEEVIRTTP